MSIRETARRPFLYIFEVQITPLPLFLKGARMIFQILKLVFTLEPAMTRIHI